MSTALVGSGTTSIEVMLPARDPWQSRQGLIVKKAPPGFVRKPSVSAWPNALHMMTALKKVGGQIN